jgi:hypothetical protein
MTGFWYTKTETPNRQTLWYSALGLGVSHRIRERSSWLTVLGYHRRIHRYRDQ